MSESFARRDREKEERLYTALGATLNNFIVREGASNGVIAHACGEFLAATLAFLSASSLDDAAQVEKRLQVYTEALQTSVRRNVQQYYADPLSLVF